MKKTAICCALAAWASIGAALPAAAHTQFFGGILSEETEVTHLNPPSQGTGAALVTLNDHDFTLRVETIFFGLTGTTTIAHIHCCTPLAGSGTAGVATQQPSFASFPVGVTFGSYARTFDMTDAASWNPAYITANGGSTSSAFAALATGINDGKAYLNLHTSAVPGGEIRTFLAPVPEPETYALMLAGLGIIGWVAARRRKVAV